MNDTLQVIDALADKLGTTADRLIEAYTPWVFANAIVPLVFGVVLLIAAVFTLRATLSALRQRDEDAAAHFGILTAILVIGCAIVLSVSIPDLAAPHAAAIQKILQDLGMICR